MALVTKSIGTSGRDYSTIVLWEDDLDVGAGGAGNDAVGEMFKDSVFDEQPTINDATPDSIKLTVPISERHDGTAGTGARIVRTSAGVSVVLDIKTTAEFFEIDSNGNQARFITLGATDSIAGNLLCHGYAGSSNGLNGIDINVRADVVNCIVYDMDMTSGFPARNLVGIDAFINTGGVTILNNTVFSITESGDPGHNVRGIVTKTGGTWKNNISMDCGDDDLSLAATKENNMSSDATATGTGSLANKLSVNQFVSIVGGSEDLHLKAGADAIDAGQDLGTLPTGVNIDIDGFDRDADTSRDPWDIGAHEFPPAVGIPGSILADPLQDPLQDPLVDPIPC